MKTELSPRGLPLRLLLALISTSLCGWAQSSLLSLDSIAVTHGGPVEFTFADQGTGATNYVAEFSPAVGAGATWQVDTNAVITSLGNARYQVSREGPSPASGFYRVIAFGGQGGPIVIGFASATLEATEGGMVAPVVNFSAPFTGTLRYRISGTAGSGDFEELTGELTVSNSLSAVLPVTFTDNEEVGRLKFLTLRLEPGPGYVLASPSTTINLLENDSQWRGSLESAAAVLEFVFTLRDHSGLQTAWLRSDPAGFFPTNDVPVSVAFSEDEFSAVSEEILLPPAATTLQESLRVILRLEAMNGLPDQSVAPAEVEGVATLLTRVPAFPFLDTTNVGRFRMVRPPGSPSTNQVELNPL